MKKRLLSIFLVFTMVFSLVPAMSITASAETAVTYRYAVYNSGESYQGIDHWEVTSVPDTEYTLVEDGSGVVWDAGYYVVKGTDVKITDGLTCLSSAVVHLILCDGAKLTVTGKQDGYTASDALTVNGSLYVYGQAEGTGVLNVVGADGYDGSNAIKVTNGSNDNFTIFGGNVFAAGGNGTVEYGKGGTGVYNGVTINGGSLTAKGGNGATEGLGGAGMSEGNYIANGGTMTAIGGSGFSGTNASIGIIESSSSGAFYPNGVRVEESPDGAAWTTWVAGGNPMFSKQYVRFKPVAQITSGEKAGITYGSVQAAINAAATGETVQMISNSTENVTVSGTVSGNKSIILDLNGKTLAGAASGGPVISIGSLCSVTLKDGSTGGKITGGTGKTAKLKTTGGGVNVAADGTFNMESGMIIGNNVTGFGGGVYVIGTFNMSGGTITGNTAGQLGGGVYNEGITTVSGTAKISGNTTGSGETVKTNNVYLPNNKTITVSDALTTGASIGVTLGTTDGTGVVTGNNSFDYHEYFISDNTALLSYNDTTGGTNAQVVKLVPTYTLTSAVSGLTSGGGVNFTVGGNTVSTSPAGATVTATATAVSGFTAKLTSSDVSFTTHANGTATFTMPANAVTVTATYTEVKNVCYIDANSNGTFDGSDVKYETIASALQTAGTTATTIRMIADDTENISIASGQTITLDLNGFVLKADLSDGDKHSVITNNGVLTITDNSDGTAVHYFSLPDGESKAGLWTWISAPTQAQTEAAVTVDTITSTSTLIKVTGGVITGGWGSNPIAELQTYGGAVNNTETGSLSMNGVSVVGSPCSGSSVFNKGTMKVSDSFILGNAGSGICNYGTFELTGSAVRYNDAGTYGGGVYNVGSFTADKTLIDSNNAGAGGGIRNEANSKMVMNCICNISNSVISNNTAKYKGGIDSVASGKTGDYSIEISLIKTSVTGNKADDSYGGICAMGGDATLIDCTITGNKAPYVGGMYAGALSIGGATKICDNEGGNLYIESPVTLGTSTDGTNGNKIPVPTKDMNVWVRLVSGDGVVIAGNVTTADATDYHSCFHSDVDCFYVDYNANTQKVVLLSRITGQPTAKNAYTVTANAEGLTDLAYPTYLWKEYEKKTTAPTVAQVLNGTLDGNTNTVTTTTTAGPPAVIANPAYPEIGCLTFTSDDQNLSVFSGELKHDGNVYTYRTDAYSFLINNNGNAITLTDVKYVTETVTPLKDTDHQLSSYEVGKNYYCVLTFKDGTTLDSDIVTASHIHKWSYAAAGATITATCGNGDTGHDGSVTDTLTIVAPTPPTYDGTAKAASIKDSKTTLGGLTTLPDIQYQKKTGESTYDTATTTAPTAAGTYRASITVDTNKTAYVEYTIVPATITNISVAQSGTLTYTASAQSASVSASATTVNSQTYTFTYSDSATGTFGSTVPSFTNANAYTVYYKVSAPNHSEASGSFTVTIGKADQTVSAPTEASKTVSSVTLTAAAAGQGDTYYAKSTENTKPTADSAAWQTGTEFTGLSMNTQYYFFVKYAGNSNYNAAISEGTAITTANHAHTWSYSLKSGATDTLEATCTGSGTCDSTANKTLTIVAPTSPTYDGTAKAASIKDSKTSLGGLTTLPDIQYQKKTGESTYATATTTAPTAAGTYKASITVDTNKTAYVEYTIAPKQLTIGGTTVGNKTYDGSTTATATAGTLSGVASGDTGNVTVSIQSADFADKNVGEDKTVTVKYSISGTAAANYLAPVDDSSFSADISQKQLTISTESGKSTTVSGKTYDGTTTAAATIGTVIGIVTNDSVTVSVDSATFDTKDVGTGKSVAVAYKVSGTDAGNYEKPVDETKTASITAKPINVTADNKNSYVGSDLATLTYTVDTTTPLVSGEALTGALTTDADKAVVGSAYQITQGTLTNANNPNYSITFTAGTYTVKALETQTLSFPDGDQTKTYGDAAFTKTVSGASTTVTYESSDTTVATVNSATGEVNILKAGTTMITAKAAASATYAAAEASYTLTVNNASQSAPNAGKTDETIKGKADGKLTTLTDAMEYRKAADSTYTAITGTEVTGLAAGDYKVRYAAKANYDASPDQTLTIAEGSTLTLTFDAKGGTVADQIPGLTWQETVSVPETTKTGYTFQEWNTNEAGTGSKLTAATKIEASDTYYAIWQANSYTVTFHENNGTGTMEPQSFVYDAAQSLTANTFTRSGFNFTGWAGTAGAKYAVYLDGAVVKNLTAAANGNVDLYAVWTEKPVYSVSGRVQQEKVPSPENVPNALVELKQGRNVIASTHTDSNGDYAFTGIESGEYNIVVTGHASGTRDKTKTTLILLEGENKTGVNVLLPQGDISSVVEVKNNTPQILAGGLDEEAVKQAVGNPTDTVRLVLTVESVEDVTSTPGAPAAQAAAQTAIKQEASGKTVDFIDMDVTKFINVLPGSAIHETDTVLEIIVPYQTAGRTDITVYRFHDADGDGNLDAGQQIAMTKLDTRPTAPYTDNTYYVGDGFIAIYTKFFSAYAIGYRTTSPGGISGGTTTYTITGEDTGNGKLTVSTKTSASGKEITITVKPDEGYQLTKLTLTDEAGNAIALTKVNETTYTFIMPASDVTVSAIFTKTGKCPQDNTCVYAKFTDSDPKAWYHPGVHFCVEKGYMVGISDTKFAPSGTLSRAMIVTMLWRMEGSPVVNYAMTFKDVADGQWYTEAIRWAQSTGVVKGYDEYSFGPNDNVTREQLAAILMRYAAFKGIDVSKRADLKQFTDANSISDWALENVKWANAVGMILGRTETTIVPTGNATRAEAANMLQRFCETVLK